jgi:hypothetical protein
VAKYKDKWMRMIRKHENELEIDLDDECVVRVQLER